MFLKKCIVVGLVALSLAACGSTGRKVAKQYVPRPEPTDAELGVLCKEVVANKVEPKYPVAAAFKGISGWVLIRYHLDGSGKPSGVVAVDSEPKGVFDKSALRAVEAWRFVEGERRDACASLIQFYVVKPAT